MASEVNICNLALSRIGEDSITSLTEDSKPARICNLVYESTRDSLLRAHPWNFAVARQELGQLTTTPAFGYTYEYQLPSDSLRVLRMEETDQEFKVEGRKLLTDESACKIMYLKQVTDPNEFDPMFIDVLAQKIAFEVAISLSDNATLADLVHSVYEKKLSAARSMDGQEGTPDDITVDEWVNSRL